MVAGQQCIVVHWLAKEPGPRNNYTRRLVSLTLDRISQFRLHLAIRFEGLLHYGFMK